jgi:hypothetical protein
LGGNSALCLEHVMGIFEPALYRPFAIGFLVGTLVVGARIFSHLHGLLS